MKKIIRNIIAVILISIGIIGGVIPILQGWMFVLTGYIILDFKKKHIFENKIINILKKYKITRGLAVLWEKVKSINKDVIDKEKNDKVRNIYHDIHRDIDKKDEE